MASSSKASPCTLRWPEVQIGDDGSGLPVGGLAVLADPQDLAAQRAHVLGELGLAGLAGGDVEPAVRPEDHPAAVVVRGLRDAGEDRPQLAQPAVLEGRAEDPVVLGGGGVEEHPLVPRRTTVTPPRRAARPHPRPRPPRPGRPAVDLALADPEDPTAVALGDQRRAVRAGRRCPTAPRGCARPCRSPSAGPTRRGSPTARGLDVGVGRARRVGGRRGGGLGRLTCRRARCHLRRPPATNVGTSRSVASRSMSRG